MVVEQMVLDAHEELVTLAKEAATAQKRLPTTPCRVTESDEMLRLVFQAATEGIMVADLEGSILDANEAALRMFGVNSLKELATAGIAPRIPVGEYGQGLGRILSKGWAKNIRCQLAAGNGRTVDAELNIAIAKDSAGMPTRLLVCVKDVTGEREWRDKLFQPDRLGLQPARCLPARVTS